MTATLRSGGENSSASIFIGDASLGLAQRLDKCKAGQAVFSTWRSEVKSAGRGQPSLNPLDDGDTGRITKIFFKAGVDLFPSPVEPVEIKMK